MKADVVIIGAGPAGSTVAGSAASEGLKVIVMEKEKEIGKSPCAGYVSCIDFPNIDQEVIQSRINKMRTYFPSGMYKDFSINGFNVNRDLFDRELALNASGCGAKFYMNSPVTDLIRKEGRYCGVQVKDGRGVRARIIVGADGASSTISMLLGFKNDIAIAAQYEISKIDIDPEINEIYFDTDYAPGCYSWIFPMGKESAKVGLGIRSNLTRNSAVNYLNKFIKEHPIASKKLKDGLMTRLVKGAIPVGGLHERIQRDNVLLVGDSAGMTDPITGAGISYAITAGKIAARVIVKSIEKDDPSFLTKYENGFRRIMNKHYELALRKRKLMDSFKDNESLEQNIPRVWVTFKEYWH